MPLWMFHCVTCAATTERLFTSFAASINATCETCGNVLERLPATSNFTVTGYNAKNLYSKKS